MKRFTLNFVDKDIDKPPMFLHTSLALKAIAISIQNRFLIKRSVLNCKNYLVIYFVFADGARKVDCLKIVWNKKREQLHKRTDCKFRTPSILRNFNAIPKIRLSKFASPERNISIFILKPNGVVCEKLIRKNLY